MKTAGIIGGIGPGSTAVEDFFRYAIDREDIRWILEHFPAAAGLNRAKVEYELQILKIISVGWSISYHLEDHPRKGVVVEPFWKEVHAFSRELSSSTEMMTGQRIDYFQTLRHRLDMYVAALAAHPKTTAPDRVVGPQFAQICGDADSLFARMTGARVFRSVVGNVGEYLRSIGWIDISRSHTATEQLNSRDS